MKHFNKIAILAMVLLFAACKNDVKETSKTEESKKEYTMPKDAHSFAKPEEAVVRHISLDLNVNFDTKVLSGTAKLGIENITGTDRLFLDSKNLTVDSVVLDDGTTTHFEQGEGIQYLGNALIISIKPETKSVTIAYKTSPKADALMWMNGEQTASGKPFMFTQSQAILARTWYPCQDSPGVKFTYSARITVPKGLMAVMSAENGTAKTEDGVYTFNMPQKVNSYLVALAVGDLEFKTLGRNCGVYAEPTMVDKAAYEFADLQDMIDAAESIYGEYVWGQYDVLVLPASFPFGGMENPRLTFATPTIIAGDRSLVSLIAHELAHSWSGNLVTNATWDDFWLNEGFTVYFEDRIMEKLYGKEYSDMLTKLGYDELKEDVKAVTEKYGKEDTHLKLNLVGRDPDDGMTSIAYEKGRFFLTTIEEAVGREKWDAFVKQYFDEFKFQSMTTERFLQYLNKELIKGDKELEAKINIDAWVYGPGIPETCPEIKSTELEKVEAAATAFKNGSAVNDIDTTGWTTHHVNHFLRNIPDSLSLERMKELDDYFKFTQSGNSEILCDWFKHTIESGYDEANPALEKFLVSVGRRKFLTPLYTRLTKTEEQRAWAVNVYRKARPTYHSVAYNTIDELLGYNPNNFK